MKTKIIVEKKNIKRNYKVLIQNLCLYLVGSLFLLFFACNSKTQTKNPKITEKIKREILLDSSTGLKTVVFYYPNGKKEFECNLLDGKRNGPIIRYFQNGEINFSGNFRQGKKDSIWTKFDSLGNIVIKENWINDHLYGRRFYTNSFEYGFEFYNSDGDLISYAIFNKNKQIKKHEGTPFYIIYNKNIVNSKSPFEIFIVLTLPIFDRFRIDLYEVSHGNKEHKLQTFEMDSFKELDLGDVAFFEKVYLEKGNYQWRLKGSLKMLHSKTFFEYNQMLNVTVE